LGRGRETRAQRGIWGGVVRPAPSAEQEFRHLFDIAVFRLGRFVPTKAEVGVIEGGGQVR
jgi:hypothetical protein